jgi:hypothetical protein
LLGPWLVLRVRPAVWDRSTSAAQLGEQGTFTSTQGSLTTDLPGKGAWPRMMGLLAQPVLDAGELGEQLPDAELGDGAVLISGHEPGLPDHIDVKRPLAVRTV